MDMGLELMKVSYVWFCPDLQQSKGPEASRGAIQWKNSMPTERRKFGNFLSAIKGLSGDRKPDPKADICSNLRWACRCTIHTWSGTILVDFDTMWGHQMAICSPTTRSNGHRALQLNLAWSGQIWVRFQHDLRQSDSHGLQNNSIKVLSLFWYRLGLFFLYLKDLELQEKNHLEEKVGHRERYKL